MDPNLYPSNSLQNPSVGPGGQTQSQTSSTNHGHDKVKPVVQGTLSQAKPSFGQRLKGVFIAQDISDVKDYVINDILLPSFRNMLVMGMVSTIYAIFFGKGSAGANRYPYGYGGYGINPYANFAARGMYGMPNPAYTAYGTMSSGVKANGQPSGATVNTNPYSTMVQPSQVRVQTRGEAELIRDQLNEIMLGFGRVSVADFFDTVGMPGNGPVDNSYGWTDLTGMHIENYPDGFGISMPKARPI